MSSIIKIVTTIEVDGALASGRHPRSLTWEHTTLVGDNPNFYQREIQQAAGEAHAEVTAGLHAYRNDSK